MSGIKLQQFKAETPERNDVKATGPMVFYAQDQVAAEKIASEKGWSAPRWTAEEASTKAVAQEDLVRRAQVSSAQASVWGPVERTGRDLRAADEKIQSQSTTQTAVNLKPTEGQSA